MLCFLLCHKSDIMLPEAVEQKGRINIIQVIAHQKESAVLRGIFKALCPQLDGQHLKEKIDDFQNRLAEEGILLFVLLFRVDSLAHQQKNTKPDGRQHQEGT